jgi:hypothetical protein
MIVLRHDDMALQIEIEWGGTARTLVQPSKCQFKQLLLLNMTLRTNKLDYLSMVGIFIRV